MRQHDLALPTSFERGAPEFSPLQVLVLLLMHVFVNKDHISSLLQMQEISANYLVKTREDGVWVFSQ